ncbi:hypothetical protein FEM48_Zijuj07G0139300 [Ziziphus jujuba var. spinosa]|uniref:Uncharacterized protein n=1 Tax=Ziziphus jujuba var. spinosa TaxID=714518 RepID=A0A978V514_ZIZJJ|nr:hypothetical protein FEM48_Zijuj07G0139300 [Ziziphus jujuba var. spinosa]
MASSTAKLTFRVVMVDHSGSEFYSGFSMGFSGISQIVLEAQKSVGWYHDESDSGIRDVRVGKKAVARRLL